MILTLKIKLDSDIDLINTIKSYTDALNFISRSEFSKGKYPTNNFKLHKEYYKIIREKFNLPSQLACSIFRDISAKYKANKHKKLSKAISFKETHVNYTFNRDFGLQDDILKLTTSNGRKKIPIIFCDYYKKWMSQHIKINDSTLIKTKHDIIYFCLSITVPEKNPIENGVTMGVDIGLSKLAVCSTNSGKTLVIPGGKVKDKKNKFQRIRTRLQSKGTRSAKRLLKKLSGRETRFMRDTNFCLVKQILNFAQINNVSNIGIEDLTGIRKSKLRKDQRRSLNSWSFYQFRFILEYKSKLEGFLVSLFSPAYTSQACSQCGYTNKKNRKSQNRFKCLSCNYDINADINASQNIELLTRLQRSNLVDWASVNKPDGSNFDNKNYLCSLISEFRSKPTTSVVGS